MDHKLPDHITGPDDLQLLELEVNRVLELSREQALRRSKTAKAPVLELSPQLLEFLDLGPGSAIPGIAELEELKAWLEQARGSAPVVHLGLPGMPAEKLKTEIVHWFRQEINPLMLLVFEYNRGLAGGFVIRLGSQIYDYSFKHALLTNNQAMVKVMKNV